MPIGGENNFTNGSLNQPSEKIADNIPNVVLLRWRDQQRDQLARVATPD
jgi:hypothetical protein